MIPILPRIPICPLILEQECLSSWIERTACFYGCTLERWTGQFSAELEPERDLDLDLSEDLRAKLSDWTGISLDRVPLVSEPARILPNFARLSFCEACWDEDAQAGNQPYVRRDWLNWTTVYCAKHESFLSAKNRTADPRATQTTWQDVWASKPNWRSAVQLQAHGLGLWTLCYKMPRQIPRCRERQMASLERFSNSADHAAREALDIVLQTWRPLSKTVGFASGLPLWLENRIEILVQAASILS